MSGTVDDQPWYRPGMSAADIAVWEAAQRTADEAPVIERGSDLYLKLRPILAGFLTQPAEQERRAA